MFQLSIIYLISLWIIW